MKKGKPKKKAPAKKILAGKPPRTPTEDTAIASIRHIKSPLEIDIKEITLKNGGLIILGKGKASDHARKKTSGWKTTRKKTIKKSEDNPKS